MTLALKSRCENLLKRRTSRSNRQNSHVAARQGQQPQHPGASRHRSRREERLVGLCTIHFLPLVVGTKDSSRQQRLHCVEQQGFGPCPWPLPISSPSPAVVHCELNKNTRRCHRQPLASRKSCRMYQTCDHAVLISGGWREQVTYPRHAQNILHFYGMLRENGFRKENIKTFFAGDGQITVDEETVDVYPATEKLTIRNHISYVCRVLNCADSFVLYLNSPTRNDGTMLLWDVNKNGVVSYKLPPTVPEAQLPC
nr:PREDICTED: uncharacterized protein LOC102357686 [Latimeria chalumnae]|eukprot:XP_014341479.1 PREDICTED: uncharacterized protein LOC102357686 [Latimeria chalumnae]